MDANQLLKNVNNLNEYIRISHDAVLNYNNIKIQFNMSTILALKKVRSLEIEYFNKCEDNGAAIKIFELILRLPPSKPWTLLGRELIYLLQYWLEAVRKHLIFHNDHWWSFLQILLRFIKKIRVKDIKVNNFLLEETAECLLDLATHIKTDVIQKHEILCLFNLCGADSSREIRFAMRKKLDCYFTKLSALLVSCGDVAVQYSIMETLLRWLLPRQDRAVRLEAAAKWFPESHFAVEALDVFLERPWSDFFQDARDFLNIHNATVGLITSVVCKRLRVGNTIVIESDGNKTQWLDLNSNTGRLSMTLEATALETLGEWTGGYGNLVLTEASAIEVKLYREGTEMLISAVSSEPPQIVPSLVMVARDGDRRLQATISPTADMVKLDGALRRIFTDKYQVLLDVSSYVAPPTHESSHMERKNTKEEKKFTNSVEPKRRRHIGYINPNHSGFATPSTASTSSLAQLHDKLAARPRFNYEKEPIGVCVRPQLSRVTEVSETEERQSFNSRVSTIKLKPYGECHKSAFSKAHIGEAKRRNESETKCLSPVSVDDNSVSCLLIATIGSADESVINDTLERFPQGNDNGDSIVDLLVLEALQSKSSDKETVGSNLGNKEITCPGAKESEDNSIGKRKRKTCTVISNSSHTEESNTEFVEGTPFSNVNVSRRTRDSNRLPWKRDATPAPTTFDEKTVEEFFSQHFVENRNGDVVISPTLAKKINETSSESSEDFDARDLELELGTKEQELGTEVEFVKPTEPEDINEPAVPDLEVIQCVNFILDRICNEFAEYSEVLHDIKGINKTIDVSKSIKRDKIDLKTPKATKKKATKGIKLKFTSYRNTRSTRQKSKLELVTLSEDINDTDKSQKKPPNIMDRIYDDEIRAEEVQEVISNTTNEKQDNNSKTPVMRRKRKLYSPKDEKSHEKRVNDEEVATDTATEVKTYDQKEPNTYYKQLEQERRDYMKKLRKRKCRTIEMAISPKTKRLNETFDNLKNGIENNEKVILADRSSTKDIAIYNFTSDSEDDDFQKETVKRKYMAPCKAGDKQKNKKVQSKRKSIRSNTKTKINRLSDNLEDERMREATVDVLNTSLHKTSHEAKIIDEPPFVNKEHTMEPMEEVNVPIENTERKKNARKRGKTEKTLSLNDKVPVLNDTIDRTESPLPGLLVEVAVPETSITNDTMTTNMVVKFKEIYEKESVYDSEHDSTRDLLQIESSNLIEANINDECNNASKVLSMPSTSTGKYTPVRKLKKSTETMKDEIEHSNRSVIKEKTKKGPVNNAKGKNKKVTSHLTNEERSKPSTVLKELNEGNIFNESTKNRRENRSTSLSNKRDSDENEVINTLEKYSEKSFDTVGNSPITAHGGFDMCENDVPPSRVSLKEILEPRNLEVADLDQSVKNFFNKLNKVIAEATFDVRPKNLGDSFGDSSDSDFVKDKINTRSTFRKDKSGVNEKHHVEKCNSKSESGRSQLGDLSNLEEVSKCSVVKLKSPIVSLTRLSSSDINKWLQPPTKNSDRIEIDRKVESNIVRNTNRSKGKKSRKEKKEDMCKTAHLTSSISPIKIFDDLIFDNRQDSVSSKDSNTEREEFESHISYTNRTSSPITSARNTKIDSRVGKSSCNSGIEASRSFASHINMTSAHGSRSESTRRKIEDFESQRMDGGPSISSVNDWFDRTAPATSQAEAITMSLKDNLSNIMEKLDTTLVEIHHDTSKRFAEMFAKAHGKFEQMRHQRRLLYKRCASDLLNGVLKLVDEQFAELDTRTQEMEEQFMAELKDDAREVIRKDCIKKKAMVELLREDV